MLVLVDNFLQQQVAKIFCLPCHDLRSLTVLVAEGEEEKEGILLFLSFLFSLPETKLCSLALEIKEEELDGAFCRPLSLLQLLLIPPLSSSSSSSSSSSLSSALNLGILPWSLSHPGQQMRA